MTIIYQTTIKALVHLYISSNPNKQLDTSILDLSKCQLQLHLIELAMIITGVVLTLCSNKKIYNISHRLDTSSDAGIIYSF